MQQYGFTGKISEFLQFIQSKDLDKKVGNKNLLETSWNIALYWFFPAVKNLFLITFFLQWNVYQVYRDVIDDARDALGKVFHNISLTPLR